jgi:hypothetical protein
LNLQSSATSGNQWFRDGAAIAGATAQAYTATTSGSYAVTTTSGGCVSSPSASVLVTVNPIPQQPTISVNGAQFTSSAATGNQWYLNGTAIAGANGQVYNATSNGTYTVGVTINGCSGAVSAPHVHTTTSITSPVLDKQMVIAPNPVRNKLEIVYSGPAATFSVELIDMKGRVLHTGGRFSSRYDLNMTPFASGNYIVRIVNTRTKEQVHRVIVKQ